MVNKKFPYPKKVMLGITHVRTNQTRYTLVNGMMHEDGKLRVDEKVYDEAMNKMKDSLTGVNRWDVLLYTAR